MKLIILGIVLTLWGCNGFDIPHDVCHYRVKIENDHYNMSRAIDIGDATPVDAHYDIFGNLFYVARGRGDKGVVFDVYILEANADMPVKVQGLPPGRSYSVAVDKLYSDVYFGTARGIYKYNYASHRAELDSSPGLKVDMIFIDKDGNKYVTESFNGYEQLYILDGVKKIPYNLLQGFSELAIDDKNNFYYIKKGVLFMLPSFSLQPSRCTFMGEVKYSGVAQITFYKDLVFVASHNLFYINKSRQIIKVDHIPGSASAVAFDKRGNFVVGVHGKMLRYKRNDCYVRENVTYKPL
ncbi:uncharacterized protein LOC105388744 [Plutella xylostella]|uniref:uncharacterized protein LOC105388744 n=1 Tax=Plutella xylostella TaxID=51655 RepID=UPI0020329F93|nr:uncharacterized protein LOC105388744 [Plutella xylostella]